MSGDLIFLIGYRGTGKSTVARLVAERLKWQWLDADSVLESRCRTTIKQVFADEGEAGFRRKEAELLEELCRSRQHVIATGGGVILRAENRARLQAAGWVVWLTADAPTIWQRISTDAGNAPRRPNLTVGGLSEVEQLLQAREPFYRECAHSITSTMGRTPQEVAGLIVTEWATSSGGQCAAH